MNQSNETANTSEIQDLSFILEQKRIDLYANMSSAPEISPDTTPEYEAPLTERAKQENYAEAETRQLLDARKAGLRKLMRSAIEFHHIV
jgi:hypothetical protein